MSSSLDFVNYVCEQLEGVGAIRSRKMFGEYMVYVNDPVWLTCWRTGPPPRPMRGPKTTTFWTRTTGKPCAGRRSWQRKSRPCPRKSPPEKQRLNV